MLGGFHLVLGLLTCQVDANSPGSGHVKLKNIFNRYLDDPAINLICCLDVLLMIDGGNCILHAIDTHQQ